MKHKMTRREFLKTLGLLGGVTAFNVGVIKMHKDELVDIVVDANTTRPSALHERPFWVKSVPEVPMGMGEITDEYQRFDYKDNVLGEGSFERYLGKEEADRLNALNVKNTMEWLKEDRPGYNLRDRALANASNLVNMSSGPFSGDDVGIQSWKPMPWTMGLRKQAAEAGAKYDVPPEIAARDVKAAARHFGAAITGITLLNERLVFSHHSNGKEIVFEDTPEPYSDDEKYVIPTSIKYVIAIANRMPYEAFMRAPSSISGAAAREGYSSMSWTSGNLAEFIRGLGYNAIPLKNGFAANVAFATLAGVGQLGRTNRIVTPEYGTMQRISVVLTDLPLAIDSPIDAGISEFCVVCKRCAEACPNNALSMEDYPTFDLPEEDTWHSRGHKAWWENSPQCIAYWREITTGCGLCFAACPWAKKDKAWLHSFVKMTSAATPAFDSFYRIMDEAFGYGPKNSDKDQNAWWDLDLPEYGIDTTQGHGSV